MANLPRAEVELAIGERHSQVGTKEARLRQKVLVLVFNILKSTFLSSTLSFQKICKLAKFITNFEMLNKFFMFP